MNILEKRIALYLKQMSANGVILKGGSHLGCCPECASGDMSWSGISVRAYCRECNWWSKTNYGTTEDGLKYLISRQLNVGVETSNMLRKYK